jgi:hypothetical protein
VLLYERLGTRALLVRAADHAVVREIRRDEYGAGAYLFAAAFVRLADGRDGLAHCPHRYDTLELEDAVSGRSLARGCRLPRGSAQPELDVFHSQLVVSPDHAWLAGAGWRWHPLGVANVWRIADVLHDPRRLDVEPIEVQPARTLIHADNVAFADERTLGVATHQDRAGSTDCVQFVDLATRTVQHVVALAAPIGGMHAWRGGGVLGLYDHVRWFDPRSGTVLHAWPHLAAGRQRGAIVARADLPPPFAVHPTQPWFAHGGADAITVVQVASPGRNVR